ncbi:MAG TPA: PKD domain-containing protein, partial [Flavobacteriales bacterium]|nr:PKD domain-containing protein [Flavobacteriales bacterium]
TGCTDAPVTFYTDATGTIEWFFGAGSVPSNIIGSPSIASYTTTGRKTFTMVVNGIPYTYSDFIDIFSTGAGLNPTIVPITPDTLCAGDIGSFTSSVTAADYTWYITRDTVVDTFAGAGFLSLSYLFDSVGTYTVILETRNTCCGVSFPDTFTVTVNPIVQPSIAIQSSDTSNTVCDGTTLTFSASADDVTDPLYAWFVNGVPVGTNSPTFSTSTLVDGDVITATVLTTSGCSIGLSDTSNSISVTVVGIPAVICTADTFITGLPTYFTSTVISGGIAPFTYIWDFGDQTMGAGDSVAHIYLSPGVYDVQVDVVDANGCPGTCNSVVTIYSLLSAAYTASLYNGCAPLTVDFNNQSTNAVTYLWEFGNGSTMAATNTSTISYTYTNPGTYDVVLYAYGASGNDSASVMNQVMVLPSPVANFQGYPQVISTLGDTVFFGDNSLDAWMWQWTFGDPASGGNNTSIIQNPAHFYALDGSYTVSLVVTNAFGCKDSVTKPGFIVVKIDTGGGVDIAAQVPGLNTITIFPNPVVSKLNVVVDVEKPGMLEITMINMSGQRVQKFSNERIPKGNTRLTYYLDDGRLNKGLYFLDVNYNGKHYYKKIILTP